jgi:hypothetical protein
LQIFMLRKFIVRALKRCPETCCLAVIAH